jgi:hypothetical protein
MNLRAIAAREQLSSEGNSPGLLQPGAFEGRCVEQINKVRFEHSGALPHSFIVMSQFDQDEIVMVLLAEQGDVAAFEELLRRLHGPLRPSRSALAMATRLCGTRDRLHPQRMFGRIIAFSEVGGLHHRYERVA